MEVIGGTKIEGENRAKDNDLCAIEAWVLSSTHPIPNVDNLDTKLALIKLFRTDRGEVLTPRNVLNGTKTIDEENTIRMALPYEDGLLSLFGPNYVFGYQHKVILGKLDEQGMVSQIEIELKKGDKVIDPSSLVLYPEYESFFDKPITVGTRVHLQIKQ